MKNKSRNMLTINIDKAESIEIVEMMNKEDKKIAIAVEKEKINIAKAIDLIVNSFNNGGRLFYIGSGSSGKLAVIDASECPPTFGVDNEMVQGIISGGEKAIAGWLEETEDNENLAVEDLKKRNIQEKDILVGVSASGNTPYVLAGVKYAKERGLKTIGISCRKENKLDKISDRSVVVDVGPEVIMGSTRLKAGTAQKMILNMLSTGSMIKIGKVYSNLMIDVKPINKKLQKRVIDIVSLATETKIEIVKITLEKCDYNPKLAIIMIKENVDLKTAIRILKQNKNKISS